MLVYCNDGCQQQFSFTKLHTSKVDKGVERNYIRCKHCGYEYTSHYTDKQVRKLQKQQRQLGVNNSRTLLIKRHMDILMEKYGTT